MRFPTNPATKSHTSTTESVESHDDHCPQTSSTLVLTDIRGATSRSSETIISEHGDIDLIEKGLYLNLLEELDYADIINWNRETDRITHGSRFPELSAETQGEQG